MKQKWHCLLPNSASAKTINTIKCGCYSSFRSPLRPPHTAFFHVLSCCLFVNTTKIKSVPPCGILSHPTNFLNKKPPGCISEINHQAIPCLSSVVVYYQQRFIGLLRTIIFFISVKLPTVFIFTIAGTAGSVNVKFQNILYNTSDKISKTGNPLNLHNFRSIIKM